MPKVSKQVKKDNQRLKAEISTAIKKAEKAGNRNIVSMLNKLAKDNPEKLQAYLKQIRK